MWINKLRHNKVLCSNENQLPITTCSMDESDKHNTKENKTTVDPWTT